MNRSATQGMFFFQNFGTLFYVLKLQQPMRREVHIHAHYYSDHVCQPGAGDA